MKILKIIKIFREVDLSVKLSSPEELPKLIRQTIGKELNELDFGFLETDEDRELIDNLCENLESDFEMSLVI